MAGSHQYSIFEGFASNMHYSPWYISASFIGILQPMADAVKLFTKKFIVSIKILKRSLCIIT